LYFVNIYTFAAGNKKSILNEMPDT